VEERRHVLAPGMSLKRVAKSEAMPERSGRLEATYCRAGMFRAESKDHEGTICKGHDRTAS
jgi:hypothetical protein